MSILDKIRRALRSPDASLAELREAYATIDLTVLAAAVGQAERARAGLLLDGTEKQLDAAEAALTTAVRERDRGIAAQAELSKRIADAEFNEAAAALDADRDVVEREAEAVKKLLIESLPDLQRQMVGILNRLETAEAAVEKHNDRRIKAGKADLVASVETRAFAAPVGQYAPLHSILKNTQLKSIDAAPGWPADRLARK